MKVLLIEDEPKTASSIKAFLDENGVDTELCLNAAEGLKKIDRQSFDVIVTDVIMPDMDGIKLSQVLRSKQIKTPILMISALDETEDKISGLNAGADDYLAKPFDLKELMARISALHRRSNLSNLSSEKINYEDLEINISTLEVTRSGKKIILTPKEFSLLEYLLRNQGRVIPKLEILEKVWNLGVEINTNVIEVYVNYLRKKIDKEFTDKLIHTHFGIGYYIKKA
ncbi:MAG: response regulator transcription factor [Saprospiraceae bacterium]|nr:response regulator transcription factor [Saprospiraceae bacterium]